MEQVSDQIRQSLDRGIAELLRLFNLLWMWSSEQSVKLAQAPWQSWPLWKQILFLFVVVAVIYFLFMAAIQLWTAAIKLLSAFATFVGAVIVTLPTILIAAVIALAGLWVINAGNVRPAWPRRYGFWSLAFPGLTKGDDIPTALR
jgi:hypothetical protein